MKTIREEVIAGITLRLIAVEEKIVGITISNGKIADRVEGSDASVVWEKIKRDAGRQRSGYFGYEGAKARFLSIFPGSFSDPGFARDERNYKLKAKKKLDDTLPLEAAIDAKGAGEAALAVFRATNLLSPFEKTRVQAMLRGPAADEFVRAAATFALGDRRSSLHRMSELLRADDTAKWTVVTYLPFLWLPKDHVFLKPMVTCEFADRVGHSFAHEYSPRLDGGIYTALLDMVKEIKTELDALEPADNIDIQSFIWVVGAYHGPASTE